MSTNGNNTLLALMLALNELETPLNADEESALSDVAAQLSIAPDAWESDIEPNLIAIIEANPNLHQLYQAAKSQLDAVNGDIPKDLLPTQSELEQVAPITAEVATRGLPPEMVESDYHSYEINNMVIGILASPKPTETTKKLSRFEKLKQFLRQPTPNR